MGVPEEPTEILGPVDAPVIPKVQSLIGRTLGRFTIVDQLGKGGSGEVFRAQQVQLGRSAVIKVLRADVVKVPNRVERFLREAKLASRLDHPYAAHIYAFGAEPDNVLWIAMEHVRGMTLDELLDLRGAMPPSVFGPLFSRLCEVVHTAHELGMVHRDIKGANVMVIERAGQLLPKLLDFGIARTEPVRRSAAAPDRGTGESGLAGLAGAASEDRRGERRDEVLTSPGADGPGLTAHGSTLGSPHYMAPEQWERPSEVDGRADIYGLGVLGYRCLAGELPFRNGTRQELSQMHRTQTPPPLPTSVPAALATAIMRALAKRPEERWPTAMAFGEAIQRASGAPAAEAVPIFDVATRDAWLRAGPQPIADALAHLTSATTTVEVDAALHELIAIACRWVAVLALAGLPTTNDPRVREHARAVVGRDDAAPWLRLAKAAVAASHDPLPALVAALEGSEPLVALAERVDDRDRPRTAATLTANVAAAAEVLHALAPLLDYQLVVGVAGDVAESWQGPRRRDRERVLVWGEPLGKGEVALLDTGHRVVARLSPFAQVIAPLPAAEPELFLLWRSGRGSARLVAAPWGFERDDDAAGTKLAALSTEESDTSADQADDRSPYPGLAAYSVNDAEHFVGREREVEALANRLVRAPLLAVLGPSGVGKSSFINAGVVPRLREQHRILTMRPGRHPLHVLATLPEVSSDEASLVSRLHELGESAQRGLVLVVDQLEELVTLCASADERRRFTEILAAAADGPSAPVRVVATLRDDFATVIESEPALRGRFEVFVLATPPPEALRRIVIEPARHRGVIVDPRVVDDMVAEVAGRPASLPLLSFTAAQLWQTRDRAEHRITHDAYLELGGVAGALATYADELYASLARRDQDTVRDLFARLVAPDGTRVPVPRSELEQLPGAKAVVAHLVDARLLVVRDDEGHDVVEIVHECLAERWPRLARWRSEDAADRALLADVRIAARRWNDAARRGDLLWRGEALAELGRLAARSTALTELERAFAAAAVRAEQRARRIRRGLLAAAMIALAGAAVVMAYLSIVANDNRVEAQRQAERATTSATLAEDRLTTSIIAQGKRELNDGRALPALAYFAEALRRGADSTGLRMMIAIAGRGWRDILATYHDTPINAIVGSPNGWIAAADRSGNVYWWSETGARLGQVNTEAGGIAMLELQADDSLLVVGRERVVHVGKNREVLRSIPLDRMSWAARYGPGADEISVLQDGYISVYGFDGKRRRGTEINTNAGYEPVFTPGARAAFVATDTREVRRLDLVTMQQKVIGTNTWGAPTGAANGSIFAFFDRDNRVHLIDPEGATIKKIDVSIRPQQLLFTPDGNRMAIVGMEEITVYDRKGERLGIYGIERDQSSFALRDDEAWIGGGDGTLRHYRDGRLIASSPVHSTEIVQSAVGGKAIGVVGTDQTLVIMRSDATHVIWDAEQPCEHPAYAAHGIAIAYECGTEMRLYVGRTHVGDYPSVFMELMLDWEPTSQRAVASGVRGIFVYDHAKVVAKSEKKGAVAFADPDHIWVADQDALWKWTYATNAWNREFATKQVSAALGLPDGVAIGHNDGKLERVKRGVVTSTVALGERVDHLTMSPDRRWLAAELTNGTTAILDVATWQVSRRLPQGDNYGAAPTFDPTGDLILRTSRQALGIWDRSTGEELVFKFDLMRGLLNARFTPDGRIEVVQVYRGLLDVPRDTRPIAQILRDIECKVPLKVVGSRIEPSTTKCP